MIRFEPCNGCGDKEAVESSVERLRGVAEDAARKTRDHFDGVAMQQEFFGIVGDEGRPARLDLQAWQAGHAVEVAQKIGAVIDSELKQARDIVLRDACAPDAECIPHNIITMAGSEACWIVRQYTGPQAT